MKIILGAKCWVACYSFVGSAQGMSKFGSRQFTTLHLVYCKTLLTALVPERRVAVQTSLAYFTIGASIFDNHYHVIDND
jgi:hypothetical protein